jgi:methyl-accepting chemotaxis protein
MQNAIAPASGDERSPSPATGALLALCAGLLPVWGRHLATSRAQSEAAVSEMLQAFSDIGPHINMAERQSQQINDALAQPIAGVTGLVSACEQVLAPVLALPGLPAASASAIDQVLGMVRHAVGALEQVARPFQHETQMVAAQVDRMYMGFQYQDRISQMMALLEGDMVKLQQALQSSAGPAPDLAAWLVQLEAQYAMREQHEHHTGLAENVGAVGDSNETTFF